MVRALLALIIAATLLAGCADDGPAGAPDADARWGLVPLPEGVRACGGDDVPALAVPSGPDREIVTVWGDGSREDPWRGPLAIVTEMNGDEFFGHEGARAVTVRGRPAQVAPMPLFQGVSSADWGHVVTLRVSPTRVVDVAVRGADAEEARALAERVDLGSGGPRLAADALGPRTTVLHREDPGDAVPEGSWIASYRGRGDVRISVVGGARRPDERELVSLYAVSAEPVEVDAPGVEDAVLTAAFDAERGPFGVTLLTAGQAVTVTAFGLGRDEVLDLARAMRPLSDAEWQEQRATAAREAAACADS